MVRWDCPPHCLSPHAPPVRSHCEELTWHPSRGAERVRVALQALRRRFTT